MSDLRRLSGTAGGQADATSHLTRIDLNTYTSDKAGEVRGRESKKLRGGENRSNVTRE